MFKLTLVISESESDFSPCDCMIMVKLVLTPLLFNLQVLHKLLYVPRADVAETSIALMLPIHLLLKAVTKQI